MKQKIARAWLFGIVAPVCVGLVGCAGYALYEAFPGAFYFMLAWLAFCAITVYALEKSGL